MQQTRRSKWRRLAQGSAAGRQRIAVFDNRIYILAAPGADLHF
jgi:hypothetical protein